MTMSFDDVEIRSLDGAILQQVATPHSGSASFDAVPWPDGASVLYVSSGSLGHAVLAKPAKPKPKKKKEALSYWSSRAASRSKSRCTRCSTASSITPLLRSATTAARSASSSSRITRW